LLVSEDGLTFWHVGLFQETFGAEVAFLFEPDGGITAVERRPGIWLAEVCRSLPPYRDWIRQDLDLPVGGPVLAKWGERYVVGGRQYLSDSTRTAFYWLKDKNRLEEFALLPSGGDNSYPDFVELSPNRAVLSWYSSHERYGDGEAETAI